MLVVARHVHVNELGACAQQAAYLLKVAGLHRLGEARHGGAIDMLPELGPAFEAVGASEHELGIVQGEALRISAAEVAIDLSDGVGLAGAIGLEQLLGLPLELK